MIVCVKCRKEMFCERNGVDVVFGTAVVYPGDLFRCKTCGTEIIRTVGLPIHKPGALTQPPDKLVLIDETRPK